MKSDIDQKIGMKGSTMTVGYAMTEDAEQERQNFVDWACAFIAKAMFGKLDKKDQGDAAKFAKNIFQLVIYLQSYRDICAVVSSWHEPTKEHPRCGFTGLGVWETITKKVPSMTNTFFDVNGPDVHHGKNMSARVDKSINRSPVYHPSDESFLQMTGEMLYIWLFGEGDFRNACRAKCSEFKIVLNTGAQDHLTRTAQFMRSFASTHELRSAKALWVVPWLANLGAALRLPYGKNGEYPRGMLFVILPSGEVGEPGPGQQLELSIIAKLKTEYSKSFNELMVSVFPVGADGPTDWLVYGKEPKTTSKSETVKEDGESFTVVTHYHGGQPERELLKGAKLNVIANGGALNQLFDKYAANAETKDFAERLFSEGNSGWESLKNLAPPKKKK